MERHHLGTTVPGPSGKVDLTGAGAAQARPPLRARALSLLARVLGTLALVVALGVAGIMLVPALLGYERYVITGDSMAGTYDRGSIVFSEAVPVSELEVGDVITYEPPPAGPEGRVTHRILSIRELTHKDGEVERVFRTKGDANASRDPWRFTLDEPTQARASFSVPYAGFAFAALGIREVRMAVIGLPALLIAILLLARLWRQAGEEARRESAAARAALDEAGLS